MSFRKRTDNHNDQNKSMSIAEYQVPSTKVT